MFAIILIPSFILLVGTFFIPETPRWLIANGKLEKAKKILSFIHEPSKVHEEIEKINFGAGQQEGTWKELFTKKLILPLSVSIAIASCNQLIGTNALLQYAPTILKNSGLSSNFLSMLGSIGIGALNFIFTIIAIFLIDKVGRRPLLLVGVGGVLVTELCMGIANYISMPEPVRGILTTAGMFSFIIFYAIGPGVVVWLAISELLPTRVRGKAMSLSLFFNSLSSTIVSTSFLYFTKTIGMSGIYWMYALFSLCYFLVATFYLKETKMQTLEEIQSFNAVRN
jgi:sugar porter (SP) family MFS transporter